MSVESAYPDRLLAYASSARADTTALAGAGTDLSRAIQDFIATQPDPQVISGVTDWGAQLTAYARQKSGVDQWVHDVGVRFRTADRGDAASHVAIDDGPDPLQGQNPFGPLPGSAATTPAAIAAQRQLARQQRRLEEEQRCTAPGHWGPLGYVPFPPDTAPRAEAVPPGTRHRAAEKQAARQALWDWLGDPEENPHLPDDIDPWVLAEALQGPEQVRYPDVDAAP